MSEDKKEDVVQPQEPTKEEMQDKNKLKPCKENSLVTQNGTVREGLGVSKEAKILMG